jgi:mutator protein MutT
MSDYYRDLRALIGRRPLVLVGATVIILDEQQRVLLQRRADNGLWGPPGGCLEPGETMEETARRETREEVGVELADLTLWQVFAGPGLFYKYPNGDQVHIVTAVYLAHLQAGQQPAADGQEARAVGWFGLDELPPLSPPVVPVLRQFLAERGIQ